MFKGLAATALSLAIAFQVPINPTQAHASTCLVAGGQSGRLKYSGQLSPISATVCGNQIWKLLGKPKKPVTPIRPSKPKKYANNFTVTPNRPRALGASSLKVGELGLFTASAKRHIRNRMLFWYPSQVRFVPKTYLWNFGDGSTALLARPRHAWAAKGMYVVKLTVGYAVKYRIIGHSSWVPLTGLVYSKSVPLHVVVADSLSKPSGQVVLVHWHCQDKPMARGC